MRTDLRTLSRVLVAFASGACAGSPPREPAPQARRDAADPAVVCTHLLDVIKPVMEAKQGGPLPPGRLAHFKTECEADERAERADGEARWRCRSGCLLGAQTPDAAEACEATCPPTPTYSNCDAVLTATELAEELGTKVRPSDGGEDDGEQTSSCSRAYIVGDRYPVVVGLATHRTSADATNSVSRPQPKAEEDEPLTGIGDVARRWRTPFEDVPACHVSVARGRVSMHLMVAQPACTWEPLRRLAGKAATRLP